MQSNIYTKIGFWYSFAGVTALPQFLFRIDWRPGVLKFYIAGTLFCTMVAALGYGIAYLGRHGKIGMPNPRHDWVCGIALVLALVYVVTGIAQLYQVADRYSRGRLPAAVKIVNS